VAAKDPPCQQATDLRGSGPSRGSPKASSASLKIEEFGPATLLGASVAGFVGTGVTTEGVDVAAALISLGIFTPRSHPRTAQCLRGDVFASRGFR
jgi:hypothetical protein